MSTSSNLQTLIGNMVPVLHEGIYVYVRYNDSLNLNDPKIIASIREPEGLSLIVEASFAAAKGLTSSFRCAWITLNVYSDLADVGLTAAFSAALGQAGISCNVIAGLHHDHLFVPIDKATPAMNALKALQQSTSA